MSAVESGRLIGVGLAKETSRGAWATPAYWPSQTTIDFLNKNKQVQIDSVFGVLNKYEGSTIVEQWAEGKIEGYLGDQMTGLLLYNILGTLTSHAVHSSETAVWDNIFNQSQSNTPQSLSITRKDQNSTFGFTRAMMKSLELNIGVGEYVKYSSDWMATFGVTQSASPTYIAENLFIPKHAVVKLAANVSGLSGASAAALKSMKLTITRSLNPYYVFGSNDVNEIYVEDFTVTGDMTLRYADQTFETPFYNNTPQAMSIDLKNTGVTIGTASNPELILTLPQQVFSTWSLAQDKDKIVEQTIGFQGQYNLTAAQEVTATLTNTVNGF